MKNRKVATRGALTLAQLIKDKKLQMPDAAKQPNDLAPNHGPRRQMNRL